MMKNVPFFKYTAYGNNFVMLDETRKSILSEHEKSSFACPATNIYYGVGSDNFICIQPCNQETLKEINISRNYWEKPPNTANADYIFRMFEPDGKEAFCCGNGLICIANYLYRQYGIKSTNMVTEIPTANPKIVSIGTNPKNGQSWVNMSSPRRIPSEIADLSNMPPYDNAINIIENIEIIFRAHELDSFSSKRSLKISGYLVFTGEPHLVVFVETGLSIKALAKIMFISSCQNISRVEKVEKRVSFGSWLVHHIGTFINKRFTHLFPIGININFVWINKDANALEYRCFERGINRETMACGTGALAASFVARRLNLFKKDQVIILPHLCRLNDPNAQIQVETDKNVWLLHGEPLLLVKGDFMLQAPLIKK